MDAFSFLDTSVFVNGIEITGWGEGDDSITLARLNDSASHIIGNDGLMTVNLSADRSGAVTFNLLQTASSNAYMSGLITLQENDAFIPIFVQFKDSRNHDLGSGTQGYIPKPADITRGGTVQNQEWIIVVERLDLIHVGS